MFYCLNKIARRAALQLQRQADLASEWFSKWRLRINESKTIAILFGRTKPARVDQIKLNNLPIKWEKNAKYLGVTIDRNLTFSTHATNIIKRAIKIRGMLYGVLNKKIPIPAKTRLNLLPMYIVPTISYAGAAWAPFIRKTTWKRI